jgi:signal recognition particle subunit SRP72
MSAPAKTLTSLLQRSTIDDHDEILRACNSSLKASKKDLEIQHLKLVALLKLDRYDDALRVLEESGDELKQRAGVERAYALYRVGELEEAKSIAKGITGERGARAVEAQAVS